MLTFAITFNTVLMYFTIENPDVILLKEYEKSLNYSKKVNEEKEMFIFNLARDIKKPITQIYSISRNSITKSENDEIKNNFDTINKLSNNSLYIIEKAFNIAANEKAKLRISINDYNPTLLFLRLSKIFKNRIQQANLTYKEHIDKDFPNKLLGDDTAIKHILYIILNNSIKHTKNGFISLVIYGKRIEDIYRLTIEVSDSGKGIKMDEIDKILDKNNLLTDFAFDNTKENLALCKLLLNAMDGQLIINSEEGKGTNIKIVLDQQMKRSESNQLIKMKNDVDDYIKKYRIGIIINNDKLREKVCDLFNSEFFELISDNCIYKIKTNEKFSLFVFDDSSENDLMNGTYLFNSLRNKLNAPSVIISKSSNENLKKKYTDDGFVAIITRDKLDKELPKVICELIEKKGIVK